MSAVHDGTRPLPQPLYYAPCTYIVIVLSTPVHLPYTIAKYTASIRGVRPSDVMWCRVIRGLFRRGADGANKFLLQVLERLVVAFRFVIKDNWREAQDLTTKCLCAYLFPSSQFSLSHCLSPGSFIMSGTVIDKATAFKNSLTGSGINKIVCKASSHEVNGPKKKHVDCEYMWRVRRVLLKMR